MFGQPWAIPGYIEAEYYDFGGEGVSHDTFCAPGLSTLGLPRVRGRSTPLAQYVSLTAVGF